MKIMGEGHNFSVYSNAHEGNNLIKIFKSAAQIYRNHFSYERFG